MGGLNTVSRALENTAPAYKEKARLSNGGLCPARDDIGIKYGYLQLIEERLGRNEMSKVHNTMV